MNSDAVKHCYLGRQGRRRRNKKVKGRRERRREEGKEKGKEKRKKVKYKKEKR